MLTSGRATVGVLRLGLVRVSPCLMVSGVSILLSDKVVLCEVIGVTGVMAGQVHVQIGYFLWASLTSLFFVLSISASVAELVVARGVVPAVMGGMSAAVSSAAVRPVGMKDGVTVAGRVGVAGAGFVFTMVFRCARSSF